MFFSAVLGQRIIQQLSGDVLKGLPLPLEAKENDASTCCTAVVSETCSVDIFVSLSPKKGTSQYTLVKKIYLKISTSKIKTFYYFSKLTLMPGLGCFMISFSYNLTILLFLLFFFPCFFVSFLIYYRPRTGQLD